MGPRAPGAVSVAGRGGRICQTALPMVPCPGCQSYLCPLVLPSTALQHPLSLATRGGAWAWVGPWKGPSREGWVSEGQGCLVSGQRAEPWASVC